MSTSHNMHNSNNKTKTRKANKGEKEKNGNPLLYNFAANKHIMFLRFRSFSHLVSNEEAQRKAKE